MLAKTWKLRVSYPSKMKSLTLLWTHLITCDPQTLPTRPSDLIQPTKQACLLRNGTKVKTVPHKRKLRSLIRLIMRAFRKTRYAKLRKKSVRGVNGISIETSFLRSATKSPNSSIIATTGTALLQLMLIIGRTSKLTLREWFLPFTWLNHLAWTGQNTRATPAQNQWMIN